MREMEVLSSNVMEIKCQEIDVKGYAKNRTRNILVIHWDTSSNFWVGKFPLIKQVGESNI